MGRLIVPRRLAGGRRPAATILLTALLAVQLGRGSLAWAAEEPERQLREIAATLQCPVCQNISVADSPSELAQQMRQLIAQKLAAGESREQIVAHFVDRYGEEVLLDPPKRGFNLLLWGGPGLLLAAAAGALARSLARWRRPRADAPDGLEVGRW
jgi:cytochrome c-type biogenesis protein CcmH